MKKGDLVVEKKTGKRGVINSALPHPFAPNWLIKPNYLVLIDGETKVFTKKEIELWQE